MRTALITLTAATLSLGLLGLANAADTQAPAASETQAPGASSDITIVERSDTPGGTGVEQSSEGKGAMNKNDAGMPGSGAGSANIGGDSTGKEPGTGVEDSAQGEGATNKAGMDDEKEGKNVNQGGPSAANVPGGSGVEASSQSEGAKSKTTPN
jgi:hypothetical protein